MTSKVYVVTCEAVYMHSVVGVYSTEGLAKNAATAAAMLDHDAYHSYNVYEYNLNESLSPNGSSSRSIFDMPTTLDSVNKDDTR